jgi:U4/U6 small nuclear ribonucleoprotein PRP4
VESQEKHNKQLHKLELSRRARAIVVPTNDDFVKAKLREIGQPIILFGEKVLPHCFIPSSPNSNLQPEDRRERLREHLAKLGVSDGFPVTAKEGAGKQKREDRDKDQQEDNEGYLTEGIPELKAARIWIAGYSIPKAKLRIAAAKRRREQPQTQAVHSKEISKDSFARFVNATSEIGDERPLSAIGFAPNSNLIATGGWSGSCKLWEISGISTCRHTTTFRGHSERIHDVAFHPKSTIDLSPQVVNFATCSSDRTVRLWGLASDEASTNDSTTSNNNNNNINSKSSSGLSYITTMASLTGHEDRVNNVEFHPSGRYPVFILLVEIF